MSTLVRAKATLVLSALLLTMCAGPAALAASPSGGAQQAVGIVALRHAADGTQTRIILEGTAELPYTIYRPDERTILVDLPGVDAAKLDEGYAIDSKGVERIQVERLRTASGQSLARLRIRLKTPVEDRTVVEGKNLVLTLTSTVAQTTAPAPAPAAPAAPAAPSGQEVASMRAEVPPPAKPVQASSAPTLAPVRPAATAVPNNPATVVSAVRTDVQGGVFRAFVTVDGRASFKQFVLPNPDRIVVDITGVRSTVERSALEINNGGISRIRVGQFRTADPRVVRIVFDVAKMGPYEVRQVGSDLVLSLGDGGGDVAAAAPKPTAPATPAADASRAATAPEARPVAQPPARKPIVAADESDNPAAVKPAPRVEPKPVAPAPATPKPTASKPAAATSKPAEAPRDPARNPAMMSSAPVRPVAEELEPQGTTGRRPAATTAATQGQPTPNGPAMAPRQQAAPPAPIVPSQTQEGYLTEGFVGRPVNLELKNVDLRDILRFLHSQYNVNFIVDKSIVGPVPIDVSVTGVPWNQALDAILKAQGLGAVREGSIIRIAAIGALATEQQQALLVEQARFDRLPLVTKIYRLKYSSPGGRGAGTAGAGAGNFSSVDPSSQRTGLFAFISNRLSKRGRVEFDPRSNSIIVTDLASRLDVIEQIIRALDRPEPQVEIEARIVIARRNFMRDLGVQVSAGVQNTATGGFAGISSIPVQTTASAAVPNQSGTGLGLPGVQPTIPGGLANGPTVTEGNTIINLTTGILGTYQISAVIFAAERKGQLRTISAPRVTTQNNTTAEVVNGVQIPVQTVTNNTVTTTFVDAALKLVITPQIIIEDGAVLLTVLAQNNNVSTLRTVNGTPGIDTQSATAVVLVPDGGTTVIGGINIDSENQDETRTPGLSRIPIFGNLFKRRITNRDAQEILFFITPRIFRPEFVGLPQESSVRSNDITITPVIPAGSDGGPTPTALPSSGEESGPGGGTD